MPEEALPQGLLAKVYGMREDGKAGLRFFCLQTFWDSKSMQKLLSLCLVGSGHVLLPLRFNNLMFLSILFHPFPGSFWSTDLITHLWCPGMSWMLCQGSEVEATCATAAALEAYASFVASYGCLQAIYAN